MDKPPLGIIPRKLWNEQRVNELANAIIRFANAKVLIPYVWIDEYNELLELSDEI